MTPARNRNIGRTPFGFMRVGFGLIERIEVGSYGFKTGKSFASSSSDNEMRSMEAQEVHA